MQFLDFRVIILHHHHHHHLERRYPRIDRHPVFLSGVAPTLHSIHCCYHLLVSHPSICVYWIYGDSRSRQAPFPPSKPLRHCPCKASADQNGSLLRCITSVILLTYKETRLVDGKREEDTTSCSAHAPFTSLNCACTSHRSSGNDNWSLTIIGLLRY